MSSPQVMAGIQAGEHFLDRGDAKVWFKVSEAASSAPTAIYLHGGPGYNSFGFEKAVEPFIKSKVRMVYLDQRGGAGRTRVSDKADLSMDAITEDIEAIRRTLGVETVSLIGHSFGGLVALEFLKRFPAAVEKIILVDIAADLPAAFQHQIDTAYARSASAFPQHQARLREILDSHQPVSKKLSLFYDTITRVPLQREILFVSEDAQARKEKWDEDSGLMDGAGDAPERLYRGLMAIGYLDSPHLELRHKIAVPAVLFAGKHSHCIGIENIGRAAKEWEVPVEWFSESGHFPYLEEPLQFTEKVVKFLEK